MQILQPKQHLLSDYFNKIRCNTCLLVPLNKGEQILAEGFEDEAYVDIFWCTMVEGVQEGDYVVATTM
ncbi:hypothetical protein A0H81_00383 [Grifola frondosa]|uniref:Uncharacterized protein n=1 Tax=Grifola frondosa TaxID=5627 RepID=A0A1C7MQW4_GRIFR|nr:hypothetical protein A0H81_00383 [Grifola frondosa]